MEKNPRGYAFIAFRNAWNRSQRWGWFRAATVSKVGFTSMHEYIDHCLAMYDAQVQHADHEQLEPLVDSIIRDASRLVYQHSRGFFAETTDDDGKRIIVPVDTPTFDGPMYESDVIDEWQPPMISVEDTGFADVENVDAMKHKLRLLARRLSDEDMEVLTLYVSGEADTLKGAALALGYTKDQYTTIYRRIRRIGLRMKEDIVNA